jgi:hypothetical protein
MVGSYVQTLGRCLQPRLPKDSNLLALKNGTVALYTYGVGLL